MKIHRYDINSAYPAQMVNLPSYADAEWEQSEEWDGTDYSMVHVKWFFKDERPFYPLWYREHDGTILYPRWGEGVYWGVELRNLTDFPDGCDYEIIDAINCRVASHIKPFDFIRGDYETRLMFKAAGNMASEALKLGINSLYGKCAQQAGYRDGRVPTYHQLLWAGQTTAGTRRQLYQAAMQAPESIIAFATDAVICTAELDLPSSTKMGEWTHDIFDGITIVQPGVYWLKKDGEWGEKYRGFDKGSLMREGIVDCWRNGTDYKATLTRFVGMGSALMSTNFDEVWRTWPKQDRTLTLTPTGKRIAGPVTCYADQLCDTIAAPNLNPDVMSMPYPLSWSLPKDLIPKIDGVDVDILEDELLDSYA